MPIEIFIHEFLPSRDYNAIRGRTRLSEPLTCDHRKKFPHKNLAGIFETRQVKKSAVSDRGLLK